MDTIQQLVNNHFVKMCEQGNLPQVKYWLEQGDLQIKAQINTDKDCAIIAACCKGHTEIVKYLLTSEKLNPHANIHAERDASFRFAYANYSSSHSHTKQIIHYLIWEYNITLTDNIQKELNLYPNYEVIEMFKKRECEKNVDNKNSLPPSKKPYLFIVK